MITKGIRGAITIDCNSEDSIKTSVLELFSEIVKRNSISEQYVSHVIFTSTPDINAAYPAKFVRQNFGWNNTAFLCLQEMNVAQSLNMCIRVLVVYNCSEDFEPVFVYLKGAKNLRT